MGIEDFTFYVRGENFIHIIVKKKKENFIQIIVKKNKENFIHVIAFPAN